MFSAVIFSSVYTRTAQGSFANGLYYASVLWLPALNYLIIFTLAAWAVLGISLNFSLNMNPKHLQYAVFALTAFTMTWGISNYYNLKHTKIEVPVKNLPETWSKKKILLISDLHIGNYRNEHFVKKSVEKLNAQKPDIIIIAGDLFDGAAFNIQRVEEELSRLEATEAVYFSYGNHEHYSDSTAVAQISKAAGFTVLNNRSLTHHGVNISGIQHQDMRNPAIHAQLKNDISEENKNAPTLFICHEPLRDKAALESLGVDLQLSGHTHNGQFFPFNLITRAIYGKMNYGLSDFGSFYSYTSSGMGVWGPAFRCMSRSEFVEIQLINK
jgi:predicted MPP superfamily phosphohydrolase